MAWAVAVMAVAVKEGTAKGAVGSFQPGVASATQPAAPPRAHLPHRPHASVYTNVAFPSSRILLVRLHQSSVYQQLTLPLIVGESTSK